VDLPRKDKAGATDRSRAAKKMFEAGPSAMEVDGEGDEAAGAGAAPSVKGDEEVDGVLDALDFTGLSEEQLRAQDQASRDDVDK
jgi:hypothetical protein